MIYFLVHIGGNFPDYTKYCVNQIYKKDNNCKIYLCGDTKPNFIDKEYIFINVNELDLPLDNNYLLNDPNPLWRTSLMRIFAINSFMQKTGIEGIIHFDNDVMIYDNFSNIKDKFGKKNYITPHKTTEYAFGFSYLNNKDDFNKLSEKIKETIILGEGEVRRRTGDEAHEMRLLNFCGKDLIESLPVHPELDSVEKFIFDPSSYGQYIGGTPNGHAPGFVDETQLVGSFLKQKPTIMYSKKEDAYYLPYKDNNYKIFNLHIHSKKLNDFYNE
jgi:hypothetical protein